MRALLIAITLLAVTFAGCADSGDTEPVDSTESHDHDSHDHNETIDEHVEVNNTAPVATLTADVMNGTAPLLVNFTLDGTDADGDNLTWTFVGNETVEGTELPTVLNATLDEGNHTFVFTVSDGELTHSVNLTIEVIAGEPDVDPNAPVDYGTFTYDPVTGHCHFKSYTDIGGLGELYNFDFWMWAEDNGVPGLQVGNTFPVGPAEDQGFRMDEWDICEDADLMLF